uniref:Uncharacterized protein n=1 Tax=Chromera velia CCMP2878 TaxID=1169474 RepID=A0A0K6S7F3_9ALVE|eukprot:Cvel_19997.t1-p1 / transcript=Cvel_19997.t1 / gene=Cvel_19997 / organism=Chromera_velia_CCMP2878 / gene_product=hypothetical protein / transcript_product=hypothetical protein / location=Cvel_scaffold1762:20930-25504(+) / protein_length=592 / sequence_SO=supercontig / SO=protein_coding / is_pseudo=false
MEAGGGLAETLAATRVGIEVVLAQSLKEADAEGESAEEMEEKVNKLRKGAKGVQVSLWATVAPPTVLKGRLARLRGRAVVLYSKKSLRRQLNASATLHASWRSCIEEDTFQQHRIFLGDVGCYPYFLPSFTSVHEEQKQRMQKLSEKRKARKEKSQEGAENFEVYTVILDARDDWAVCRVGMRRWVGEGSSATAGVLCLAKRHEVPMQVSGEGLKFTTEIPRKSSRTDPWRVSGRKYVYLPDEGLRTGPGSVPRGVCCYRVEFRGKEGNPGERSVEWIPKLEKNNAKTAAIRSLVQEFHQKEGIPPYRDVIEDIVESKGGSYRVFFAPLQRIENAGHPNDLLKTRNAKGCNLPLPLQVALRESVILYRRERQSQSECWEDQLVRRRISEEETRERENLPEWLPPEWELVEGSVARRDVEGEGELDGHESDETTKKTKKGKRNEKRGPREEASVEDGLSTPAEEKTDQGKARSQVAASSSVSVSRRQKGPPSSHLKEGGKDAVSKAEGEREKVKKMRKEKTERDAEKSRDKGAKKLKKTKKTKEEREWNSEKEPEGEGELQGVRKRKWAEELDEEEFMSPPRPSRRRLEEDEE